jgi:hypothetical protein
MKRQLVVATSLALLVFAASPSFAVNGNINIFADEGQAICASPLGFQTNLKLYVYAQQQGASLSGITGAEYQISPSSGTDWIWGEDFSPAIGDGATLIGAGAMTGGLPGINVAYDACRDGGGSILLQCVNVVDISGVFANVPVTLTVRAHSVPGNPFFRCPLFTLCDDPIFTKVCLGQNNDVVQCPFPPGAIACNVSSSGEFFINPTSSQSNCTVAVEETTWSDVKSLFN